MPLKPPSLKSQQPHLLRLEGQLLPQGIYLALELHGGCGCRHVARGNGGGLCSRRRQRRLLRSQLATV